MTFYSERQLTVKRHNVQAGLYDCSVFLEVHKYLALGVRGWKSGSVSANRFSCKSSSQSTKEKYVKNIGFVFFTTN
jgi:hypothetical protein